MVASLNAHQNSSSVFLPFFPLVFGAICDLQLASTFDVRRNLNGEREKYSDKQLDHYCLSHGSLDHHQKKPPERKGNAHPFPVSL